MKIDKHNTTKTIKCMSTCRESTHNPAGVSTHVEIIAPVVADSLVHNSTYTLGMKTDRIRTDITDIVFVFIFVFEYRVRYA